MFDFDVYDIIQYGTRILIIFMILPLHEYAHAWMAKKQGDDTALYSGRLTLNPIAHIDPIGALFLLLTGFGWAKPVPINPLRFKNQRKGIAITAAAGPISNLIAAFLSMILLKVLLLTPFYENLYIDFAAGESNMIYIIHVIYYFVEINIGLAIFNLIPIPPLDGSKIVSYFTTAKFDRFIMQYQQIIYILFIFLLFSPILRTPLMFIRGAVYDLFNLMTSFIPENIFSLIYGL